MKTANRFFFTLAMLAVLALSSVQWAKASPVAGPDQSAVQASEKDGKWVVLHTLEISHPMTVTGFVDDKIGITAGPSGVMYYTDDGGKNWTSGKNNSLCRYGLDVLDKDLMYTVGNGGMVRVSTDAGKTWTALTSLPNSMPTRLISFADDQYGWAATPKQLFATDDGAKTWTELALPDGLNYLVGAIDRVDEKVGYILSLKNELWSTEDAGKTWKSQSLALDDDNKIDSLGTPALRFVDADTALIAYRSKGEQTVVLRSTDAGKTWKPQIVDVDVDQAIYVLSHDGTMLTVSAPKKVVVAQYQLPK